MQWNELSKKTAGIILALIVLFAGILGVLAVLLVRRRGGDEIAKMVKEAVEAERITSGSDGEKIVADRLLVTFRLNVSDASRQAVAKQVGAKILGTVEDSPSTFILSFTSVFSVRQLNSLRELLMQSPDVADAETIKVD